MALVESKQRGGRQLDTRGDGFRSFFLREALTAFPPDFAIPCGQGDPRGVGYGGYFQCHVHGNMMIFSMKASVVGSQTNRESHTENISKAILELTTYVYSRRNQDHVKQTSTIEQRCSGNHL